MTGPAGEPVPSGTWKEQKSDIRRRRLIRWADGVAPERDQWIKRHRAYYRDEMTFLRFLIPPGRRVLQVGCGTGELLAGIDASARVGLEISPAMAQLARDKYPELDIREGDAENPDVFDSIDGPFDYVILSDVVGYFEECDVVFSALRKVCSPQTRVIVAYYSKLWALPLQLAEILGLKMRTDNMNNWLSLDDLTNLLAISGFDVVRRERRQLIPFDLFGLGKTFNRFVGSLPLVNRLCLRSYLVARPLMREKPNPNDTSISVVIPIRNERGNVENAIHRLPVFGSPQEIIFVEGHSSDGSYEEALRVQEAYPERNITVTRQEGKGKADAVWRGFGLAKGDILMILDGDLSTPPELMPKFYNAMIEDKGEFVHGTRFVYPMEQESMQFLNYWGNRVFSSVFSWLLSQRFTDTLCGTKVLWRRDWKIMYEEAAHFRKVDPFGDFALIFGAAKMGLQIREIPIKYREREYGSTQISRFRHGLLLFKMVAIGWLKIKTV